MIRHYYSLTISKFHTLNILQSLSSLSFLDDHLKISVSHIWNFHLWNNLIISLAAVQPVFNPFSQFVRLLELYPQSQLSLWSDPITFSVPKSTWCVLVKIQCDGNLAETQMMKWLKFEHFLISWTNWKVTLKPLISYFRYKIMVELGENAPVYSLLP